MGGEIQHFLHEFFADFLVPKLQIDTQIGEEQRVVQALDIGKEGLKCGRGTFASHATYEVIIRITYERVLAEHHIHQSTRHGPFR